MRITNVTIRRYRAFDGEVAVPLSQLTVLTGPNNLGKSTVLRALNVFFEAIDPLRSRHVRLDYRNRTDAGYSHDDDYPKRYEGRVGRRWPTQIALDVDLAPEDVTQAKADLGLDLKPQLNVAVEFSREDERTKISTKVSVIDDAQSSRQFLRWFSERFRYVYIPAIRSTDSRRPVFAELVDNAIRGIKRSRQRIALIDGFLRDVKAEISSVESALVDELRAYLPDIKNIEFKFDEMDLLRLVTVSDVQIDDGARTSLQNKGDGFKSLFAMSAAQFLAKRRHGSSNLIFGIEEPESHLHSTAIYQIKDTLRSLSQTFQVIVTTHSPVLVQRDQLEANIVVELRAGGGAFSSTAAPARTLGEIRRSLGIKPYENMVTAEVVLVVEGATEETIIPALLGKLEPAAAAAFAGGRLRVLPAHGAANVPAVVRALARDATSVVVLFDADEEGRNASGRLSSSGLIDASDIFTVPPRPDCKETEFEDLFDPDLYLDPVSTACGLSIAPLEFAESRRKSGGKGNRSQKWSVVMRSVFDDRGKNWDDLGDRAKEAFAKAVRDQIAKVPTGSLAWARGIAMRINGYLAEQ